MPRPRVSTRITSAWEEGRHRTDGPAVIQLLRPPFVKRRAGVPTIYTGMIWRETLALPKPDDPHSNCVIDTKFDRDGILVGLG
jgi:hypothetical protein